jgi:hypothetical protein
MRLGGALGIAASFVGLALFLAGCAGFDAAFKGMSLIPFGLGLVGLVLTIIGAIIEKERITEDTHVLGALFPCICGILGGLLEMTIWLGWRLF